MGGFGDLIGDFEDIIGGDKNEDPKPDIGPLSNDSEDDSWGEEKNWSSGQQEDIWRSVDSDAVWDSGQPARDVGPADDDDDDEGDFDYYDEDEDDGDFDSLSLDDF